MNLFIKTKSRRKEMLFSLLFVYFNLTFLLFSYEKVNGSPTLGQESSQIDVSSHRTKNRLPDNEIRSSSSYLTQTGSSEHKHPDNVHKIRNDVYPHPVKKQKKQEYNLVAHTASIPSSNLQTLKSVDHQFSIDGETDPLPSKPGSRHSNPSKKHASKFKRPPKMKNRFTKIIELIIQKGEFGSINNFIKSSSICQDLNNHQSLSLLSKIKSMYVTKSVYTSCQFDPNTLSSLVKLVVLDEEINSSSTSQEELAFYKSDHETSHNLLVKGLKENKLMAFWEALHQNYPKLVHLDVLDAKHGGVLHHMILDKYLENRLDLIEKVLDSDLVDINRQDLFGNTPLHLCMLPDLYQLVRHVPTFLSATTCVNVFLNKNAKFDIFNGFGLSAFHYAASLKYSGPLKLMFKEGANIDLQRKAYEGELPKLPTYQRSIRLAENGPTPIITSILGVFEIAQQKDTGHYSYLMFMDKSELHRYTKDLRQHRSLMDRKDEQESSAFYFLVTSGAKIGLQFKGKNALQWTLLEDNPAYASIIVDFIKDVDILNQADQNGKTPFDIAALKKWDFVKKKIKKLVEKGVHLNQAEPIYSEETIIPTQTTDVSNLYQKNIYPTASPHLKLSTSGEETNEFQLEETLDTFFDILNDKRFEEHSWDSVAPLEIPSLDLHSSTIIPEQSAFMHSDIFTTKHHPHAAQQGASTNIIPTLNVHPADPLLPPPSAQNAFRFVPTHPSPISQWQLGLQQQTKPFTKHSQAIIDRFGLHQDANQNNNPLMFGHSQAPPHFSILSFLPPQNGEIHPQHHPQQLFPPSQLGSHPALQHAQQVTSPVHFPQKSSLGAQYHNNAFNNPPVIKQSNDQTLLQHPKFPGAQGHNSQTFIHPALALSPKFVSNLIGPQFSVTLKSILSGIKHKHPPEKIAKTLLNVLRHLPDIKAQYQDISQLNPDHHLDIPSYHFLVYVAILTQNADLIAMLTRKVPAQVLSQIEAVSVEHGLHVPAIKLNEFLSSYVSITDEFENGVLSICTMLTESPWIYNHILSVRMTASMISYCFTHQSTNVKWVYFRDFPSRRGISYESFMSFLKGLFPNAQISSF